VLAIQDTTVARSGGSGRQYLPAVLAVDAEDGAILGLIDGVFLHRAPCWCVRRRVATGTAHALSRATSNAITREKQPSVSVLVDDVRAGIRRSRRHMTNDWDDLQRRRGHAAGRRRQSATGKDQQGNQ